ncbi:MHYT domain-containing protein [Myceligenerans salitolerans]|uniref:MHYT domain-containing protein n=1 Tax=Myceligenerans salitolerans TaxID=1230528 RepID=UPI001F5E42E5|nr:MHYT domain-containing protein [Myceligenerans salitolerans]
MSITDHFAYGSITPVLAFLLSCTGCAVGLSCTSRSRAATGFARVAWLSLGAVAIGGTGIWVMHFVAMLGFVPQGVTIRYDIPLTLLSAGVAIVVVGIGLFVNQIGGQRLPSMVIGGFLTGSGVATMHYMGMAAMEMNATMSFNGMYVIASVIIAIVAATAALWCTTHIRGAVATIVATIVMGIAVTGMHYTGMMGVRLSGGTDAIPNGVSTGELLVPLVMAVSVVTLLLVLVVGLWPTESELRAQAEFEARLKESQDRENSRPAPTLAATTEALRAGHGNLTGAPSGFGTTGSPVPGQADAGKLRPRSMQFR